MYALWKRITGSRNAVTMLGNFSLVAVEAAEIIALQRIDDR